jgi:hypothetical protein
VLPWRDGIPRLAPVTIATRPSLDDVIMLVPRGLAGPAGRHPATLFWGDPRGGEFYICVLPALCGAQIFFLVRSQQPSIFAFVRRDRYQAMPASGGGVAVNIDNGIHDVVDHERDLPMLHLRLSNRLTALSDR